ncbi:MAG: energy transducer TonB [Robiginitomaculum sp.]|nr:energy transducer TonB [Robiginitomaculum sp.]
MNLIKRIIISGPGAFVVTTGLALIMAKMIYVPFADLPDKPGKMDFTINPEIREVIIEPKMKPQQLKKIVPPPALPIIERQTRSLPTVPIALLECCYPRKKRIKLDLTTVNLVVSDKDVQPILRFEPNMPPRAQKSGHCIVRLSVNAYGQPFNIVATKCSQSIFKRPTIKAVAKWKYNPKIKDGQAVDRHGVETLITFALTDENGRPIPE